MPSQRTQMSRSLTIARLFQLPVPKTRREGLARNGRDSTQVPVEFTDGQ